MSEPVSGTPKFPASWENTGIFVDFTGKWPSSMAKTAAESVPYQPIPYAF
jgi:hypothetical protein